MAAVDATDCAIEGTVICAKRAEDLVTRAGPAGSAAACGRGGAALELARIAEGLVGVLLAIVLGLTTAVLAEVALATDLAFAMEGGEDFFLTANLAASFTDIFLADIFSGNSVLRGLLAGTFLPPAFIRGLTGAFLAVTLAAALTLIVLATFLAPVFMALDPGLALAVGLPLLPSALS